MSHDHHVHIGGHHRAAPSAAAGSAARGRSRHRLRLTLALAAAYMLAEVIGGLLTGSLALLADAGHMLSDVGALAFSLFAMRIAQRPRTIQRTYGYHRAEILAALANATVLLAISLFIVVEALRRLAQPTEVQGIPMLAIAAGGLLVNLAGLWLLSRDRDASLNVRGAWLHVLTDALGSVQAIVAGAIIAVWGWMWVDPLASIVISILVAYSSWHLLREAVEVLMEAVPRHIDVAEVERCLHRLPGVCEVHDLHVWTITSGFVALSAHVVADRPSAELLGRMRALLSDQFGIEHSTIQVEPERVLHGIQPAPEGSGARGDGAKKQG